MLHLPCWLYVADQIRAQELTRSILSTGLLSQEAFDDILSNKDVTTVPQEINQVMFWVHCHHHAPVHHHGQDGVMRLTTNAPTSYPYPTNAPP
jgi:hypothetical protein